MFFRLFGDVPAPDVPWTEDVKIAFYIGSFGVPWYAIFIMFGFILAIVLACLKMWKRYKISIEPFYWFILIGVPFGIFGANFGSCVLGEPAGKPWSEFWSSFGSGLAIEWGLIFVLIAAAIYFPLVLRSPKYRVRDEFGPLPVVKKVSWWLYVDAIAPCVLLAQFLGRWGNYFNQEVYGAVVTNDNLAWFLHNCLPWMYIVKDGMYHQPLFLWEGIGNAAMFFALYFGAEFIKQRKAGDLAAGYFLWYGLFRICLEPLRDSQYYSPVNMAISAIFIAFGAAFIIINHFVIARVRDKKMFAIFKYSPIEACKVVAASYNPFKIHFLERKVAINEYNDKKTKYQDKLNVVKNQSDSFNNKYQSNEFKQFNRVDSELIYFGRW